jgi:ABC-type multidrug transport system fused ATPase/permease subunit
MNDAVIRESDKASVANLNAQRILIYSIQLVTFIFLAIYLSVKLTLIALVIFIVLFLINRVVSSYIHQIAVIQNSTTKQLSSSTVELQRNKKFFKASLLGDFILNRLYEYAERVAKCAKKSHLLVHSQNLFSYTVTFSFLITLISLHDFLKIELSQLLVILFVFHRISPYFNALMNTYLQLCDCLPAHLSLNNRLKDFKNNEEKKGKQKIASNQEIRFDHVGYSYTSGKEVLKNINLEIKPFQATAFVGGSGAGKSTILDLILGLLKTEEGRIFYGDTPYQEINTDSFRKKVAYVSQEITLLDGSIIENLTIGRMDEFSDSTIKSICEKVSIDKMIDNLPNGLQTEIGENGIKLSGGQKQRIALGRALLMKPEILILDEATNQLDSESESLIQDAITNLHRELTIIIVAHRLSTVKFVDKVYVVEEGRICESGKYNELVAKKGRLYELDSLQHGISYQGK